MTYDWIVRYDQHFARHFGKPFDRETYHPDTAGPPLQIVTYDLPSRKHRIFASLGLTEYVAEIKDVGEVIVLTDDAWKDVPYLLVNALFFMIRQRIRLGSRFAIGGVEALLPDFAEQFDKSAIYFTPASGFAAGFERVAMAEQMGSVYQGLFISDAENALLVGFGADELEEQLRDQGGDLSSLRRTSCV